MPDHEISSQVPHDAGSVPSRHPGLGPLCERCGTAAGARDHAWLCDSMRERPALWADGWVDLAAFGLDEGSASDWPDVRTSPIVQVMYGGLGPEGMRTTTGPWVRHPDPTVPTWRRVAALAVLRAAGEAHSQAISKVIHARAAQLDAWCKRRALAIRTTGCGATHYVRIERGSVPDRDRCRSSAKDRGEMLWRFTSSARCQQVLARWRATDIGGAQLDATGDADHRYRRVGHNEGVLAAFRVCVMATLARVRGDLIEAGEPDRWLVLEGRPSPVGTTAELHPSTRPLAMALVTAPPTWLWSTEALAVA